MKDFYQCLLDKTCEYYYVKELKDYPTIYAFQFIFIFNL